MVMGAMLMLFGYAFTAYAGNTDTVQATKDTKDKKIVLSDIDALNTAPAAIPQPAVTQTQTKVSTAVEQGKPVATTQQDKKVIQQDIQDIRSDRKKLADAIKAGDQSKIAELRQNFRGDIRSLAADLSSNTTQPAWARGRDWREIQRDIQDIRRDRDELAAAIKSGDPSKIVELRTELRGDVRDLVGDVARSVTNKNDPRLIWMDWRDTQRDYRDIVRDREQLAEALASGDQSKIAELRKDLRGDARELRDDIALNLKEIKKAGWDQGKDWEAVQDWLGQIREDRTQLKNAIKEGDTYKIRQERQELIADQQQLVRNLSELYRDHASPSR
jgi:hypothetical protein